MITPADPKTYNWPSIEMDPNKLVALIEFLMSENVQYGLGAKIEPLSKMTGIQAVDCSGCVRWLVFHATEDYMSIPDGSVNQHDWCEQKGFKKSDFQGALQHDNGVRIAFLTPEASGEGIGHVMLVINGMTLESHGHHGPDRRVWGTEGFMSKCSVFVLTPPIA